MENFKAGQEIWIERIKTSGRKATFYKSTITKVGRKFFYADDMKFDLKTLAEVSQWSPENFAYIDPQIYYEKFERKESFMFIHRYFNTWGNEKIIPLEKLRQIKSILEMELSPDEKDKLLRM